MDAWPWVVFDPIRGWQNEAGYQHPDFRIDARGFRASPFAPPTGRTAARALRIVCLGDSRTFGVWRDRASIRFDADYPSRLEAEIRRFRRGPLEVINAGVIGYSSSNGLHQYVTRILDLGPDVVIATFGFNDHLLSFAPARRIEESRNPLARQLRYALSSSALYRLAEGTRQSIGFLHPKPFSVRWVTPERYAENLRRFGEVSRENGIRLLLLAFPLRPIERGDSVQSSRHPDRNPTRAPGWRTWRDSTGSMTRIERSCAGPRRRRSSPSWSWTRSSCAMRPERSTAPTTWSTSTSRVRTSSPRRPTPGCEAWDGWTPTEARAAQRRGRTGKDLDRSKYFK
jgi:lysophospholipase L1-like esterase